MILSKKINESRGGTHPEEAMLERERGGPDRSRDRSFLSVQHQPSLPLYALASFPHRSSVRAPSSLPALVLPRDKRGESPVAAATD